MQFPWWYPYRFSFIFSFWVILIAFEGLIHPLKNQIIKPIVSALIVMLFTIYSAVTYLPKASDYLTSNQIQFGLIIFTAAMLFWVGFQSKNFNPLLKPILIIFMSIDLSINAIWSLNRISYVSQTEFATYSAAARQAIDQIKEKTNDFTRIGTNFSRTKNDPIQIGYNSGSSFNSNLETNMLKAMTALGQPTTSGNVSYMNGTLITDSLLSFKYWSFVDEQAEHSPFLTRSVRHDVLNRYQRLDSTQYSNSYLNQFALPLGLTTKSKVSNRLDGNDPLKYQSQLMQQVSGQSAPLFSDITNQAQIYFSNVTSTPTIKNGLLTKKNLSKSASVTFEFEPNNNNPIYITAGSQMSHDNADIFVNNQRITEDIDYEHPIVLSIADQAKGKKVRIQIVLKKQTMLLSDFSVAELNYSQFKRDYQQSKSNGLTNVKASGNHVTANLTVKKDQPYLFTSIPYSPGWRIKINGHKINSTQMANYFLGSSTKLNAGKYKVTLTYLPPLLTLGFSISLLGIIGWLFLLIRRKRH